MLHCRRGGDCLGGLLMTSADDRKSDDSAKTLSIAESVARIIENAPAEVQKYSEQAFERLNDGLNMASSGNVMSTRAVR